MAVAKHDHLVADRDKFLNQEPENLEQWIKANSALLGMKLEGKSRESEEMISVTKALEELWGLDKGTAKKIMAIVVTATVELSIILLSFLAGVIDKPRRAVEGAEVDDVAGKIQEATVANVDSVAEEPRNVAVKKKKTGSVAKARITEKATDERNEGTATPNIDEESLEKFVIAFREHYTKTGELAPLRILSRKQRNVRKVLKTFSHDDLEKLFSK